MHDHLKIVPRSFPRRPPPGPHHRRKLGGGLLGRGRRPGEVSRHQAHHDFKHSVLATTADIGDYYRSRGFTAVPTFLKQYKVPREGAGPTAQEAYAAFLTAKEQEIAAESREGLGVGGAGDQGGRAMTIEGAGRRVGSLAESGRARNMDPQTDAALSYAEQPDVGSRAKDYVGMRGGAGSVVVGPADISDPQGTAQHFSSSTDAR